MKRVLLLLSLVTLIACSENKGKEKPVDNDPIPAISVFTPLSAEMLSAIAKTDEFFVDFYEDTHDEFHSFTDVERARFDDITYRGLYRMIYDWRIDTVANDRRWKKYEKEWERLPASNRPGDPYPYIVTRIDEEIWAKYPREGAFLKYCDERDRWH